MTESTGGCNQETVCILGMHRSGTSLLTRMLNLIGVYLGSDQLLMPSDEDNPKGYWEHNEIVSINESILQRHGGSWDEPPILPAGWETAGVIGDLTQHAQTLIQDQFAEAEMWGWKDPRTCLTLPFWQQLLPDLRYIICLRNPVDVALSLELRNGFPAEKSSHLWLTYMTSALEYTAGRPRLIVFYEDLMDDCLQELTRLADFLGKSERAEQVEVQAAVQEFAEKGLQHHRTSIVQATADATIDLSARALHLAQRISVSLERKEIPSQKGIDREIEEALEILSQHSRASGQSNPHLEPLAEPESVGRK